MANAPHNKKHGLSGTPTFSSWKSMKARCLNPREPSYKNYGGRGIKVCDRWLESFENFLSDMGERPDGMTLDRYPDVNGNYEPGNCRWATNSQQARNRRSSRLITIDGVTKCASDWGDELGVSPMTLMARIDHSGMTPEQAASHCLHKKHRKQDRSKIRVVRGSDHPNSKLAASDVLEIYQMKGRKTQAELSEKFGISQGHISRIWTGGTWVHITGARKC